MQVDHVALRTGNTLPISKVKWETDFLSIPYHNWMGIDLDMGAGYPAPSLYAHMTNPNSFS